MADIDLIASVYPLTEVRIDANSRYARSPTLEPTTYIRGSREQTAEPDDNLPCIEVRFSDTPRTSHGIVFGADPKCDVVVLKKGISSHHFSITFDNTNRPIIRDWGSLVGTQVTYDGEGRGKRSDFQWIIGGHTTPEGKGHIIVHMLKTISFQVVVAKHDINSHAYIDKVARFRRGTASTEDRFGDLSLPSRRATEQPTGFHTLSKQPIYLTKKLGEGSFGAVTHYWNVSDGTEYALKEPTDESVRRRGRQNPEWIREAHIMSRISHPNVVKLLKTKFSPHPQLYLEYLPGGSLDNPKYRNLTSHEHLSILRQCLSALAYLHEKKPPIAHRDIKPSNILVHHRSCGSIHVKFADFGLSRDLSAQLKTFCGTKAYMAPEVYQALRYFNFESDDGRYYTPAVDVWSLGLVVYGLMCDLPEWSGEAGGADWCEAVVEEYRRDAEQWPSELRRFLLKNMIVISAEERLSARECYDLAMLLPGEDAGGLTPRISPKDLEESSEDEVTNGPAAWQPTALSLHSLPSNCPTPGVNLSEPEDDADNTWRTVVWQPGSRVTTRKRTAGSQLSPPSEGRHSKRREEKVDAVSDLRESIE
ncbi:Fc.00g034840.m01.CDS01 [Cosmosporella sp. VM-42]